MTAIKIDKISKAFGEKQVLRAFSADIAEGKATAIMGPSGSGKTTLLRIIAGLEKADHGAVSFSGDDTVRMMFQEDRLLEYFSAADNIRFACPGLSEQTINDALKGVGLEDTKGQPVSQFSGGMKRRTAFVRALLSKCDILLLDEPFNGLDEKSRLLAVEFLKKHQNGRTVFMTTHRRDEAEMLEAKIIELK